MISFLRGRVAAKLPQQVVMDVGGVGFACGVSATTSMALPAPGTDEEVTLHTYLQVRDDAFALFGFATTEERVAFERLIAITGVGPKLALSVLSSFSPDVLREVVAVGDEKRMATVPGVGKKTASRMILELKDAFKTDVLGASGVLPGFPGASPASAAGALDEAAQALLSMGFTPDEAKLALKGYDGPQDVESAHQVRAEAAREHGLMWEADADKDLWEDAPRTRERIVTAELTEDDLEADRTLRPQMLDEYIGQERAKQSLRVAIDAAKSRRESLDHLLLSGPPGLGKTTLASVVANEMGAQVRTTSGPAIERTGDLAAILTNLSEETSCSSTRSIVSTTPSRRSSIPRWRTSSSTS